MIFVDYRSMARHYKFMLSHDHHKTGVIIVEEEERLFPNSFIYFLYKIHYSRINSIVNLPLKSLWYNYLIPNNIDKTKQYCFILSPSIIISYGDAFVKYLRSKYQCKIVLVIGDKISTYSKSFDVNALKRSLDLVCTYNPVDSKKYNILLHPGVVYNLQVENIKPFVERENDVFFIGQEKGRGDQISEIYNKCKSIGLKCDFNIVGETIFPHVDGIHYSNWIPFEDVFERMKNAKSIINILQPGASGITQRDSEAYSLGCYLITNNKSEELNRIFNDEQVINIEDIKKEVAESIQSRAEAFTKRENKYTLDGFYNWIEQTLQS